jgi:hypothetical protein
LYAGCDNASEWMNWKLRWPLLPVMFMGRGSCERR